MLNLFGRSQPGRVVAGPSNKEDTYFFGGLWQPESPVSHTIVVGTTRSGKSQTLRIIMNTTLPKLSSRPNRRAIVFDEKQDHVSILAGMGLRDRLIITNPFDARCSGWALWEDFTGSDTAEQFGFILIPEDTGQNRYFTDAARALLSGVVNVLSDMGGRWGFSDVVYSCLNEKRLRHVLSHTEDGRDLIDQYLSGGANVVLSILSTLDTRVRPFKTIAALWRNAEEAGRTFSLGRFMGSRENAYQGERQVLLLGNNQAARGPMRAINQVLFGRLSELALDLPEVIESAAWDARRVYWFLDETRKLGKIEGLPDLLTNGASKGNVVLMGFQAVEGMYAVWGKDQANEIVSLASNIAIYKVSGVETPRFACELMGEHERWDKSYSTSGGMSGDNESSGWTENENLRERKNFLPSEFRALPLPSRSRGLTGIFYSDFAGRPYTTTVSGEDVERLRGQRSPRDPDFVPWPGEGYKRLRSWRAGDYERLGLTPIVGATIEPPPAASNEPELRRLSEVGRFV